MRMMSARGVILVLLALYFAGTECACSRSSPSPSTWSPPEATELEAALDDDVAQLFGGWLMFARTASKDRIKFIHDLAARRIVQPTFVQSGPRTGYNRGHGRLSTDRFGATTSELFVIRCDEPPLQEGQFILVVAHHGDNLEKWESELLAVQVFLVTEESGHLVWKAMQPTNPSPPQFTLVEDPFEVRIRDTTELIVQNSAANSEYVVPVDPP